MNQFTSLAVAHLDTVIEAGEVRSSTALAIRHLIAELKKAESPAQAATAKEPRIDSQVFMNLENTIGRQKQEILDLEMKLAIKSACLAEVEGILLGKVILTPEVHKELMSGLLSRDSAMERAASELKRLIESASFISGRTIVERAHSILIEPEREGYVECLERIADEADAIAHRRYETCGKFPDLSRMLARRHLIRNRVPR